MGCYRTSESVQIIDPISWIISVPDRIRGVLNKVSAGSIVFRSVGPSRASLNRNPDVLRKIPEHPEASIGS